MMIPLESVNRMSLPLDCALADRFESVANEIRTGKFVRFDDPETVDQVKIRSESPWRGRVGHQVNT